MAVTVRAGVAVPVAATALTPTDRSPTERSYSPARTVSRSVTVADDGPGIPDTRKESVFEPTEGGNHGLGFYLVDSLVGDYGGSVRVLDNEPRGAVFEVRLPAA